MYGLNRLNSAKHLRSLFTAAKHHRNPPFALTHSASCRDIDDFVYVGKGYKICGKDEIESSMISDPHNTNKLKFSQKRNKKHTYKRKVLPPKLMSKTVVKLTCESTADGGMCDVYLVGTNHICEESAQEVTNVIKFLKPQVVFLELCSSRINFLTRQPNKVPTMGEMLEMWKRNEDSFSILYKWYQAKLVSRWGIVAGGECRVAYEEAMKYGGKAILNDQPREITVRRTLTKMSAWQYLFHPGSNYVRIPEDLIKTAKDEMDYVNLVSQEMTGMFPTYTEPFLHERNRYMSAKILKVAREHNTVVALVGMGHLEGIQKHWKQHVDVKQLLETGTLTTGKILSAFGAMVVYISLSGSMVHKIRILLSGILYDIQEVKTFFRVKRDV